MSSRFAKAYDEYLGLSIQELLEIMADRGEAGTKANFARHIYEERQQKNQQEYDAGQIELKFKKDRENIEYQHSLNKKVLEEQTDIFRKQLKSMRTATAVTATATLLAALVGGFLGNRLSQGDKPLQIKLDSEQFAQLQKANNVSVPVAKTKRDKFPSHAPINKTTTDPNEKGRVPR